MARAEPNMSGRWSLSFLYPLLANSLLTIALVASVGAVVLLVHSMTVWWSPDGTLTLANNWLIIYQWFHVLLVFLVFASTSKYNVYLIIRYSFEASLYAPIYK